ncbi:hypothetical protein C8N24_2872 [Solirubrobacter pauli]|uniref:Uncharacterized protein n=1 Tax=Solirubrobacter pauli TaxID=166793 RepID=A0A660LGP4_9ACTN|nr:hypothetical protein [Solirubrobacter pauli]RKQ93013.1 hypothetical protein C8N24_2872 [Solirubrobacter pauli]
MRSRVLKTGRPIAAIVVTMFRTSLLLATARVAAIAAFTSMVVLAPRALAAPVASPPAPTFQVLHNDHIGAVGVPAGAYTLTPFGGLTSTQATQRFSRFLQDYDGVLPAPWTLDPATMTFSAGTLGFTIAPAAPGTPASATTPGRRCPGVFQVEHDDRIAGIAFPAGAYQFTSLRSTCSTNMSSFRRLLARPGSTLPAPWSLNAQTGTFSTAAGARFQVKPAA